MRPLVPLAPATPDRADPPDGTGSLRVPHDAAAVAGARRAVVTALRSDPHCAAAADDAAVVVSELLGNAVRHALPLAGGVVLRWRCAPSQVVVEVVDGGSASSPHAEAVSAGATGGRGLAMVGVLSQSWGSSTDRDGHRTVWARLPLPPSSAARAS